MSDLPPYRTKIPLKIHPKHISDHRQVHFEDMEHVPQSEESIAPPVNSERNVPKSDSPLQGPNDDPHHPIQGTSFTTSLYRLAKFPLSWMYHKAIGYRPVNELRVFSRYLPIFYQIPREFQNEILPYVKSHAVYLPESDKLVVAEVDLKNCRDSKVWFLRNRSSLVQRKLLTVPFTDQIIAELDLAAEGQFGRFLQHEWDSGKLQAYDEMKYQKRIRGE